MSSKSDSFSYQGQISTDEAIERLEKIVNLMKGGSIKLESNDESILIEPENEAELSIEAKRKDSKQNLSIELYWKTPKPKKGGLLNITDGYVPEETNTDSLSTESNA